MPLYEYHCSNCGHKLEELQKMSDPPLEKCPACGKITLKRLIGIGAGLIFKGSGFYLTDYKKSNSSSAESSGKKDKSKHAKETSPNKDKKDSLKKDKKCIL